MADQLCTIAQVKARLTGFSAGDVTDDTMLTEIVNEVSAAIQNYCGRKLVPDNAATYVFDTESGQTLRIPYGIRTITSMGVAQTHQPDAAGTYVTIPAADILLRPKAIDAPIGWPFFEVRITRGTKTGTVAYFARADNGCTITGNFGFAATPDDIQSVAIDACAVAYAIRGNPSSYIIGPDDTPISPYFAKNSRQTQTLNRYAVYI